MDQLYNETRFEKLTKVGTPIETIITPDYKKIVTVNDINGLGIPIFLHKEGEKTRTVLDSMYSDGWNEKVILPKIEKIARFNHCENVLLLPKEHSAYLGFGSDEPLTNYPIPPTGTVRPLLVALTGESAEEKGGAGVGKSTQTAVLAATLRQEGHSVEVFDFECLYAEGAGLYTQELQRKGWRGGYKEAVQIINEFWGDKKTKQPAGNLKSLGEIIEGKGTGQGLEFFRKNTYRPEIILCDMVGEPRKRHTPDGEVVNVGRAYEARDLFGLGANLTLHTDRKLLIQSAITGYRQMDRKIDWFVEEIEKELEK